MTLPLDCAIHQTLKQRGDRFKSGSKPMNLTTNNHKAPATWAFHNSSKSNTIIGSFLPRRNPLILHMLCAHIGSNNPLNLKHTTLSESSVNLVC
eukprot:6490677-Amphidinium_carterae.5